MAEVGNCERGSQLLSEVQSLLCVIENDLPCIVHLLFASDLADERQIVTHQMFIQLKARYIVFPLGILLRPDASARQCQTVGVPVFPPSLLSVPIALSHRIPTLLYAMNGSATPFALL